MLTPNSPTSRFEHVIKTYWGKKYVRGPHDVDLSAMVLDAFEVTIALVGAEGEVRAPERIVTHDMGDMTVGFHRGDVAIESVQARLDDPEASGRVRPDRVADWKEQGAAARAMLARLGQPYVYNDQNLILWDAQQWGLADLVLQVVKLPTHNRFDFLIPWVAREIVRLAKGIVDTFTRTAPAAWHELRADYPEAVSTLRDKAPAIALWAKETRTDIGKIELAEALQAVATYKFKESLVERGVVVYTFADGWTVQELRTEKALAQEGTAMQNCVGGYCKSVTAGTVRIYSIRDLSGNPHVTMELAVPPKGRAHESVGVGLSPEEFVLSDKRLYWYFGQILGKQNDTPAPDYQARAREFIDKVFAREGIGWRIVRGDPASARLSGRQLNDIDFAGITQVNGGITTFSRCDFSGSNLTGSDFNGCTLLNCNFRDATLAETIFDEADMDGSSFRHALCAFTSFRSAGLGGVVFEKARCGGAKFDRAYIDDAIFDDAILDGATFLGTKNGSSVDWSKVELSNQQKEQLGLPLVAEAEAETLDVDWRSQ